MPLRRALASQRRRARLSSYDTREERASRQSTKYLPLTPSTAGEVDSRYRARLSTYQNLLTSAIEANHQGSKVTLNVTAGQVYYIVVDGCNSGFQLERDPTVVGTERGEQRDPVVLGRGGVASRRLLCGVGGNL